MKLATLSEDGKVLAFYDSVINADNIPSDAVEITENQWQDLLEDQYSLRLIDGVVIKIEPPAPTAEEIRLAMPDKTPREFRDILIDEDVLTDAVPDEVTLAIQQIPFDKERTKALNAWQNMTEARRSDPYIDMIGAMFGYTPEQIDELWTN